ncbi:MAG: BON domain-containing protein [Planctomycetota bacterium]
MRRKYLGLAIAAITAFGPATAFGGDREIAQEIMTRLKSNRDSGALKDFTLDMKVDKGVVLFRGSVSEAEQKQLVLAAAEGVEGIAKVVDEVAVTAAESIAKAEAKVVKPKAKAMKVASVDSLRSMLGQAPKQTLEIAPGEVKPTAAVEFASGAASDQQVVSSVVNALGQAQKQGALRGFGVDVKCSGGVVSLTGRASSAQQRDQIISIAQSAPGVQGVNQSISVMSQTPAVPAQLASQRMTPLPQMAGPQPNMPAPMMPAAHQMGGAMGAPVMGTPVPMNQGGGMGAPRYDAPNLPNYAWPGYASYPNYAALTYPQQYSPSAWPYIGPFYPYPQVPLGWRKVSLEWDDGWWFLDFTDR